MCALAFPGTSAIFGVSCSLFAVLAFCFRAGRGLRVYSRAETSLRHSAEVWPFKLQKSHSWLCFDVVELASAKSDVEAMFLLCGK